jgi:hypothetical protein
MAKGKKTGGRTKGTPNKINADLKGMILGALSETGGQQYLVEQSKSNPVAFLGLIGRVLPMTIQGDKDNPVKTIFEIRWGQPESTDGN